MTHYVGLDVSQRMTAICVVDEAGHRIWRGECRTVPEEIESTVRLHAGDDARIGIETGPMAPCHYGLLAGGNRAANLARMCELLGMAAPEPEASPAAAEPATPEAHTQLCPCCGGRMRVIEIFQAGAMPHARASPSADAIRIDTS